VHAFCDNVHAALLALRSSLFAPRSSLFAPRSSLLALMTATHDETTHRFEIDLGADGVAYLAYEPAGDGVIDLQHTIVPDAAQHRGVGSALAAAAFEHARAAGLRVVPTCPFVADWLGEHPEASNLVAGEG